MAARISGISAKSTCREHLAPHVCRCVSVVFIEDEELLFRVSATMVFRIPDFELYDQFRARIRVSITGRRQ